MDISLAVTLSMRLTTIQGSYTASVLSFFSVGLQRMSLCKVRNPHQSWVDPGGCLYYKQRVVLSILCKGW